jgi:hypothetical protein
MAGKRRGGFELSVCWFRAPVKPSLAPAMSVSRNNRTWKAIWFLLWCMDLLSSALLPLLLLLGGSSRRFSGPARPSALERGCDLVDGVADVAVDRGHAREVQLSRGHRASEHLHAHGEEAAAGGLVGVTCWVALAVAGACGAGCCSRRVGGREDGEAQREERDVGRVLAAHCHLDGVHVHGRKHHEAPAVGVGAALLQHELHVLG